MDELLLNYAQAEGEKQEEIPEGASADALAKASFALNLVGGIDCYFIV